MSQCACVIYAKARAVDLCTVWSRSVLCVRVCVSHSSDRHRVWACSINQLWISLLITRCSTQACSAPACLTLTFSLISATLRALYLSDNDFEILPPDIGKLAKLQIVSNLSKFTLKSIPLFYRAVRWIYSLECVLSFITNSCVVYVLCCLGFDQFLVLNCLSPSVYACNNKELTRTTFLLFIYI